MSEYKKELLERLEELQELRKFWGKELNKECKAKPHSREYLLSNEHLNYDSKDLQESSWSRDEGHDVSKDFSATTLHLYLTCKFQIRLIQKELKKFKGN